MGRSGRSAFYCPQCQGPLREAPERLLCRRCGAEWPVREGVPYFNGADFYWSELGREEARQLLDLAAAAGWRVAFHDYLRRTNPTAYLNAGDERRADWSCLIPLPPESVVLDLGCGWGAMAVGLARKYRRVYAVDSTVSRAAFLNLRRQQEGIPSLFVACAGDDFTYPFPDGYFDLIALNGVLEWAGVVKEAGSPREAQRLLLAKVWAMLKPGGYLYVGIENRFGIQYFLGRPDHSGLPFTSLMPRLAARAICYVLKRSDYRTYTYTSLGYRKLLASCGFSDLQLYCLAPAYNKPRLALPADALGLLGVALMGSYNQWFSRHSVRSKLLLAMEPLIHILGRMGVLAPGKFLVPAFGIVAKKQ